MASRAAALGDTATATPSPAMTDVIAHTRSTSIPGNASAPCAADTNPKWRGVVALSATKPDFFG